MRSVFVDAFCCEWLKKRRSLGAWLIVIGAFFTPAIIIVVRLIRHAQLPALYAAPGFWTSLWRSSWESMAIFFVPMAAILATSLVVQIEVRNNAWKQVHALPLESITIFFAKLAVIVLMLAQFFVLFGLGIYLAALLPWLLVGGVPYPSAPLPLREFLADTAIYFIDCLPIVAAQYLVSLRFKQFPRTDRHRLPGLGRRARRAVVAARALRALCVHDAGLPQGHPSAPRSLRTSRAFITRSALYN
jgi:hypothetical protein